MSREPANRRAPGRTACLAVLLALATAAFGPARSQAQSVVSTPAHDAPGTAVVGGPVEVGQVVPNDVQVVRFQGPAGLQVQVLGPNPEPVPVGDGRGITTVGLKVGVPYRLRVWNLPEKPSAELYPVIEVVGHLHRPASIDPGKYPIRVVFTQDDLDDVTDRGRLVTQVIYLEDPEQALPIALPKDQIPIAITRPRAEATFNGSSAGLRLTIGIWSFGKAIGNACSGSSR